MDGSQPKETTRGPRGKDKETETGQPETRQHEYGDANPYQAPGQKTTEPPGATERETADDRVEREQER